MLDQQDIKFFSEIFNKDFHTSDSYRRAYSYDATQEKFLPDAVIFPRNEEEISKVLKHCQKKHISVVVRGAGSGFSGGSLAVCGGIVLGMEKYFNQILEIDTKNLIARVQPAVINADFQKVLEKYKLFYPPDPASQDFCSLGGNVSENAGGMRAAKYGITKDYVLALRAILPNGDQICAGKKTIKDVAGYNLAGILVGSEGTLAVITEITLKLLPLPPLKQVSVGYFLSISEAMNAVCECMASGVIPVALEFLDELTMKALESKRKLMDAPSCAKSALIVEVDGRIQEEINYQNSHIKDVFTQNGCIGFFTADSQEEYQMIWSMRRNASQSATQYGKKKLNEDITVPRSRLVELLDGIKRIGQKYGFLIPCFGHAGDGNVHVNVMVVNPEDQEELKRGYEAVEEIFALAIKLEGTLSGEHGIGIAKAPFMKLAFSDAEIQLFRSIKKAFDPNNILNPHKMGI